MIGPPRARKKTTRRIRLAVCAAAVASGALMVAACGTDFYEIPIETPIQPKLDVSAFQRVLVAGFVAGGSEDVDANQETVRLLRSQLRTKSSLKVIDADVMPLIDIAQDQRKTATSEETIPLIAANGNGNGSAPPSGNGAANGNGAAAHAAPQTLALPER